MLRLHLFVIFVVTLAISRVSSAPTSEEHKIRKQCSRWADQIVDRMTTALEGTGIPVSESHLREFCKIEANHWVIDGSTSEDIQLTYFAIYPEKLWEGWGYPKWKGANYDGLTQNEAVHNYCSYLALLEMTCFSINRS